MGKPLVRAVLDGASQIAVPTFVSTLSICIVFVPVFFLEGVAKSLFAPLALAVIFAMLFLMFGNLRYAVAVFVNVPLALVGGVVALSLRGLPFSIPAAVGFIAVAGVAVLNGVVMAGDLVRRLGLTSGTLPDQIRRSAATVLRPVLTTAMVAAFGFIPMAISTHAGAEVQRPLATVVIGGIISSTVLGLAVLPIMLRLLLPARPVETEGEPEPDAA
jgi:cobalt-zinc-cadmium resistance protein CzcA